MQRFFRDGMAREGLVLGRVVIFLRGSIISGLVVVRSNCLSVSLAHELLGEGGLFD